MATSKTPAQLDREIAEALTAVPKLTAKRGKTFSLDGDYEVRDEAGVLVALMSRDPGRKTWYEESLPGVKQTHFTERWLGDTQAEALERIARRLKR